MTLHMRAPPGVQTAPEQSGAFTPGHSLLEEAKKPKWLQFNRSDPWGYVMDLLAEWPILACLQWVLPESLRSAVRIPCQSDPPQ